MKELKFNPRRKISNILDGEKSRPIMVEGSLFREASG
jgi:hypothetical protein